MCCRIKYAENLLKKICLQVVFQTIWTFSYNCYSLDLEQQKFDMVTCGGHVSRGQWRLKFQGVGPHHPLNLGTSYMRTHGTRKSTNFAWWSNYIYHVPPRLATVSVKWMLTCILFFLILFLANLHVYLNFGASDSALVLTMCALQMLVLLLLINTFW